MPLDPSVELLWFDSMGAKSSSLCIRGPECVIAVDPGAAEMQPSYPLPAGEKRRLRRAAAERIRGCLEEAGAVVISHYHWDHAPRPGGDILVPELLRGKLVLAKNPNRYINESQWERARRLFEALAGDPGGLYVEPGSCDTPDPVEGLSLALSRGFGDYEARRRELLERGRGWFKRLVGLWCRGPWLAEGALLGGARVAWVDGREVEACGVRLRFTEPWFHGVEYDRTGWVVGFEALLPGGRRLFYTSDVMGPIIEDYAAAIAERRPDILILDGPPTYLYPYMLNRVNLSRAVENAITIVEAGIPLVVYDHHLLREARWRERVKPVLEAATRAGVELATAAEHLGGRPLIDVLAAGTRARRRRRRGSR
ncbi:MAG: MBL fold metallo-hydrolase [Desulfurococcales archaeon]|nr:MBL fold metallo-hydrolase [Desulfurococcales archaeon]